LNPRRSFVGKDFIAGKGDFRDQYFLTLVNIENDSGLILIIDLNVSFDLGRVKSFVAIRLTNGLNAFFDSLRVIEIGHTHSRQFTQLVFFELFVTGEPDLTHQGALFDMVNEDRPIGPISRQSGHIPETA